LNRRFFFFIITALSILTLFASNAVFSENIGSTSLKDSSPEVESAPQEESMSGIDGGQPEEIIPASDHDEFYRLKKYKDEFGIMNLEPYSVALINRGVRAYDEDRVEEAIRLYGQARDLSPDLPLPHLYIAKAKFSFSRKGIYATAGHYAKMWNAFWSNFWWSFQISGMLLLGLFFAVYLSFIVLVASLIFSRMKLLFHDVKENNKKIMLFIPAIILVFFGPVFGAIGLLLPFSKYMSRRERIVLYCSMAALVLMIYFLPFFSAFLEAPQDRTMRYVVRINNGIYTGEDLLAVSRKDNYESRFAYALDLKRKGFYNDAIGVYNELLNNGKSARIYNNIANCYIGLGDYDTALTYYRRALEVTRKALIYFNISQLYREKFNFVEAEKYYEQAFTINPQKVALYDSLKGPSVNSLVMDETLSNRALWDLALHRNLNNTSSMILQNIIIFFGRGLSVVMLLICTLAFYLYNKNTLAGAYRCRRCGEIYCKECEQRISSENICITCNKALVKVSELKSKDRIERILEIQSYKEERYRHMKILTFIFPGSGHIYYERPIQGFLLSLVFSFFLVSMFLWFYFPVPVSMIQVATAFKWFSCAGVVLTYSFAVELVLRRIPKKWL
jgi:tetratricopeptide (TPR) repeat protein